MIRHFRIALVIVNLLLFYFFSRTLEFFLLDVVRAFIGLSDSNAIFLNVIYLAVAAAPLILLTALTALGWSGEPQDQREMWRWCAALIGGMTAFRLYNLWWMLSATRILSQENLMQVSSGFDHWWGDRVLPFIWLGGGSVLGYKIFSWKNPKRNWFYSLISASCFLWLWVAQKMENFGGLSQLLGGFCITIASSALIAQFLKKSA